MTYFCQGWDIIETDDEPMFVRVYDGDDPVDIFVGMDLARGRDETRYMVAIPPSLPDIEKKFSEEEKVQLAIASLDTKIEVETVLVLRRASTQEVSIDGDQKAVHTEEGEKGSGGG